MPPDISVHVVDDELPVRESVQLLLQISGYTVHTYETAQSFLQQKIDDSSACLITDIRMPDMNGLELQKELLRCERRIPVVVMTGHGDIPMAVQVMKLGAIDFLEKPFEKDALIRSIRLAEETLARGNKIAPEAKPAIVETAGRKLTEREQEVMDLLVAGDPNKVIAYKLDISPRTVEVHRARIMEKMHARSLADLVRKSLMR